MVIGLILSAILLVVPFWLILPRVGIAAPWALVAVVPIGVVALLWIVAFRRWPGDVAGRF